MRSRRWIGAALALSLGLVACGGGMAASPPAASASREGIPTPAGAPAPPPPPPGQPTTKGDSQWSSVLAKTTSATVATAPHAEAMLIYTAHLTLSVFQVQRELDRVEVLARAVGGYLGARKDTEATIRVPRARFHDALTEIEKQGDVLHREVTADDVTDEFADLSVRLKNAHAMRDRLQQLLQSASVKDALEIEKELSRVTEDIERMEGKLKLMGDQIAYSTITVTFSPIDQSPVHDLARLPFPWLRDLGLSQLLDVHEATP